MTVRDHRRGSTSKEKVGERAPSQGKKDQLFLQVLVHTKGAAKEGRQAGAGLRACRDSGLSAPGLGRGLGRAAGTAVLVGPHFHHWPLLRGVQKAGGIARPPVRIGMAVPGPGACSQLARAPTQAQACRYLVPGPEASVSRLFHEGAPVHSRRSSPQEASSKDQIIVGSYCPHTWALQRLGPLASSRSCG